MSAVWVCLSFDIDGMALVSAKRALGIGLPSKLEKVMQQDQSIFFDRVLSFYDRLDAAQTVFIPTVTARAEAGRVGNLLAEGHEIGFHGWGHLPFTELTAAQEEAEFQESMAVFHKEFGIRLYGMRAPSYGISSHTPDNLIGAGMQYDSSTFADFIPSRVTLGEDSYWSLPTCADLDDWTHCVHMPELGYDQLARPPAEVLQIYKNAFDRCYAMGGCFVAVWHPFVTLSDRYIGVAEALADYIAGHVEARFSTLADMAAALEAQHRVYTQDQGEGVSHGERITRA